MCAWVVVDGWMGQREGARGSSRAVGEHAVCLLSAGRDGPRRNHELDEAGGRQVPHARAAFQQNGHAVASVRVRCSTARPRENKGCMITEHHAAG
jgi:hypothetical protein